MNYSNSQRAGVILYLTALIFGAYVYLNQMRITYVKQQLRFTDKTVDELSVELHIESAYLSRLFKKIEGVNPTQFRRIWRGN